MIHGPLPHRTSSPNHRSRPSRKSRRFEPMKNSWALFFLGSKHDVILSLSKSERSAEDQALLMFCAITRGQWFNDGNKRTALMAANHVLINAGIGVFAISPSLKRDFTNRLLRYYESDDPAPLCAWLRIMPLAGCREGSPPRSRGDLKPNGSSRGDLPSDSRYRIRLPSRKTRTMTSGHRWACRET